jgi:hypothetical protein
MPNYSGINTLVAIKINQGNSKIKPNYMDKKKLICFVIMPFSETTIQKKDFEYTINEHEWLIIFNKWIKKAVESYKKENIICKRSSIKPGNFVKGIIEDLFLSDITIADLTGQKPNVYYELGVRHGLKTGNIIITQDSNSVPSDLKSYNYLKYDYSQKNYEYEKLFIIFEKKLHDQIEFIIENKFSSDNPVSDFSGSQKKKIYNLSSKKGMTTKAFETLLNLSPDDKKGLEIAIGFYKDEFPWVFEIGKSLVPILNSDIANERKKSAIRDFLNKMERTFEDPSLIDYYKKDRLYQINFTKNYLILRDYLNNILREL